jgi:hypothetical protein
MFDKSLTLLPEYLRINVGAIGMIAYNLITI